MISTDDRLMIEKQTDIKDRSLIESTFNECNNDVYKTICALLKIKEEVKPPQTVFDDLRMICDEKAVIFQTTINYLNKNSTNKLK